MRYLIGSGHGWLGGLGFGASAIKFGDRDQWIGWDVSQQRCHLHRVIGMSRFLIRPSVRYHNLASTVLGMTLRSVGQDFEDRYKYRPWLVESFVDSDFFAGACYQATNWVAVGKTKGRGRQDREHQSARTVNAIYVYPLQADFRARMRVPNSRKPPWGFGNGLPRAHGGAHKRAMSRLCAERTSARAWGCPTRRPSQPPRSSRLPPAHGGARLAHPPAMPPSRTAARAWGWRSPWD